MLDLLLAKLPEYEVREDDLVAALRNPHAAEDNLEMLLSMEKYADREVDQMTVEKAAEVSRAGCLRLLLEHNQGVREGQGSTQSTHYMAWQEHVWAAERNEDQDEAFEMLRVLVEQGLPAEFCNLANAIRAALSNMKHSVAICELLDGVDSNLGMSSNIDDTEELYMAVAMARLGGDEKLVEWVDKKYPHLDMQKQTDEMIKTMIGQSEWRLSREPGESSEAGVRITQRLIGMLARDAGVVIPDSAMPSVAEVANEVTFKEVYRRWKEPERAVSQDMLMAAARNDDTGVLEFLLAQEPGLRLTPATIADAVKFGAASRLTLDKLLERVPELHVRDMVDVACAVNNERAAYVLRKCQGGGDDITPAQWRTLMRKSYSSSVLLRAMLDKGWVPADVDSTIQTAAKAGAVEAVRLLSTYASEDFDMPRWLSVARLRLAVERGELSVLKRLLDEGFEHHWKDDHLHFSPLDRAVGRGDVAIAEALLDAATPTPDAEAREEVLRLVRDPPPKYIYFPDTDTRDPNHFFFDDE